MRPLVRVAKNLYYDCHYSHLVTVRLFNKVWFYILHYERLSKLFSAVAYKVPKLTVIKVVFRNVAMKTKYFVPIPNYFSYI